MVDKPFQCSVRKQIFIRKRHLNTIMGSIPYLYANFTLSNSMSIPSFSHSRQAVAYKSHRLTLRTLSLSICGMELAHSMSCLYKDETGTSAIVHIAIGLSVFVWQKKNSMTHLLCKVHMNCVGSFERHPHNSTIGHSQRRDENVSVEATAWWLDEYSWFPVYSWGEREQSQDGVGDWLLRAFWSASLLCHNFPPPAEPSPPNPPHLPPLPHTQSHTYKQFLTSSCTYAICTFFSL